MRRRGLPVSAVGANERVNDRMNDRVDRFDCADGSERARRVGSVLGLFWSCVWLIWLVPVFFDALNLDRPVLRYALAAAVVAFAGCYVAHFIARSAVFAETPTAEHPGLDRRGALTFAAMWILALILIFGVGESGLTAVVFAAVAALWTVRWPWALAICVASGVGLTIAMVVAPGWSFDFGGLIALGFATVAVLAAQAAARRQRALGVARIENAQLAVQAERNRMARDLHDILGHSLTVITIKAELAGRLMDVDPARARQEVADLERLSRSALADVRGAVEGFREISLAGELSRARSALNAAGIQASLPSSVEDVPEELREPFAWTVREAVTNVLRHSGATTCAITIGSERVSVQDNGVGHDGIASGEGLVGLRERARIAGLQLQVNLVQSNGVRVSMAAPEGNA
ncbi:sensor histidine kinase [Calidifontibacter indicus]|uniref:Two-component system sensor histidine kinase DesK n=1 Tax=Calidifontibacter indicus TaxID=419650 RepID=A0A3D9UMX5_9MICO|nr:histidine kinase [Calidifontibacter indicus]REF30818.1 two-component system sensor histidine kinase DesK [Calidifontibacter indicus]